MKKYSILLQASLRRKKWKLSVIFLMMLISVAGMGTGITVLQSGNHSVEREMNRLGFGDFTIWIQGEAGDLEKEMEGVSGVERVETLPLIYASYEINGVYSDDEGQLLCGGETVPYCFITETGDPVTIGEIEPGTVYVSPALKSKFSFQTEDVITFELTRAQGRKDFRIAGFFADGIMGSAMMDMKSFLVCKEDYEMMKALLEETAEADRLGSTGAMLHVTGNGTGERNGREIFARIHEETDISLRTKFSYQKASIKSYMMLLQNVLCGFLLVFSVVLLLITLIVVGKSIRDDIETERKDIAILRTLGLSASGLKNLYFMLYVSIILAGCILGVAFVYPVSDLLAEKLVSSTGLRIRIELPGVTMVMLVAGCVLPIVTILSLTVKKMLTVSPMEAIRLKEHAKKQAGTKIKGKHLLSVVLKMGNWLGPNGEGLMNAFSVADHDIGVQPFRTDVPMDEIERVIDWYSPIKEKYELAMEDVNINGQPVTANVLSNTDYFHVLNGSVLTEWEQTLV